MGSTPALLQVSSACQEIKLINSWLYVHNDTQLYIMIRQSGGEGGGNSITQLRVQKGSVPLAILRAGVGTRNS